MVVFRYNWLYSGKTVCMLTKWLFSGKGGCIRALWFYLVKSGCIRANMVVFGRKLLYSDKMVLLAQK